MTKSTSPSINALTRICVKSLISDNASLHIFFSIRVLNNISSIMLRCKFLLGNAMHTLRPSFFFSRIFKVFFDRMREAQAEIKATVTVNTGEGMGNKPTEEGMAPPKDLGGIGRMRRGW